MLKLSCFLALAFVAVATAASVPATIDFDASSLAKNAVDPIEFVGIAGSKIYFRANATTGRTFGEYIDFCQRNGFRTASILSGAEHEAVRTYINSNNWGWNMWLGGWDINHEGVFTWVETAEEFAYSEWGRPLVPDAPVYNCVFIGARSNGAKFYDTPCATSRFVPLCQATIS